MTIDITPLETAAKIIDEMSHAVEKSAAKSPTCRIYCDQDDGVLFISTLRTLSASQAETAAAYGVAAQTLKAVAENWDCGHEGACCNCSGYIEQWDMAADEVQALTPADSKAALDEIRAEARADGMREAARLLFSFVSSLPNGRTYSYLKGWTDGVSDYADQAHAIILAAMKGTPHE